MTVSDTGIGTYEWNIDLSGFKSGIATCDAAFIQTNGLKCKSFLDSVMSDYFYCSVLFQTMCTKNGHHLNRQMCLAIMQLACPAPTAATTTRR